MKLYSGLQNIHGHLMAAIDFETTGSTAGYHEIVQVAVVPLNEDLRPHEGVRPFYSNIAPQHPERADHRATSVHGLNMADLIVSAPSSERVADMFVEWFEALELPVARRLVPLAHNWTFEFSFAKAWLGDKLFDHIFHFLPRDSMLLALTINDRAVFQGFAAPFPRVGLGEICHRLGIINERAHDALADARVAAEVYRALLHYEVV